MNARVALRISSATGRTISGFRIAKSDNSAPAAPLFTRHPPRMISTSCITGTGLKTQDAVFDALDEPSTIKPSLADVEALAGLAAAEPALV